jgi:hypothetical protein
MPFWLGLNVNVGYIQIRFSNQLPCCNLINHYHHQFIIVKASTNEIQLFENDAVNVYIDI